MKALCESSPQARHHFTRFDQVDLLVRASEATADTGFMARLMSCVPCPAPIPATGENTSASTALTGSDHDRRGPETGLPFGNLPRLLLAWVCTEAVRTQSRELVLGSSLAQVHAKLGMAIRQWWKPGGTHAAPQPDEAALQHSYPAGLRR